MFRVNTYKNQTKSPNNATISFSVCVSQKPLWPSSNWFVRKKMLFVRPILLNLELIRHKSLINFGRLWPGGYTDKEMIRVYGTTGLSLGSVMFLQASMTNKPSLRTPDNHVSLDSPQIDHSENLILCFGQILLINQETWIFIALRHSWLLQI